MRKSLSAEEKELIISSFLSTQQGRIALAQAMIEPIRVKIDMVFETMSNPLFPYEKQKTFIIDL